MGVHLSLTPLGIKGHVHLLTLSVVLRLTKINTMTTPLWGIFYLLFAGLFSLRLLFALLHWQTVLSHLEFAQTHFCSWRDDSRHGICLGLHLPDDNEGKKGQKWNGDGYFPVSSIMLDSSNKSTHRLGFCQVSSNHTCTSDFYIMTLNFDLDMVWGSLNMIQLYCVMLNLLMVMIPCNYIYFLNFSWLIENISIINTMKFTR